MNSEPLTKTDGMRIAMTSVLIAIKLVHDVDVLYDEGSDLMRQLKKDGKIYEGFKVSQIYDEEIKLLEGIDHYLY